MVLGGFRSFHVLVSTVQGKYSVGSDDFAISFDPQSAERKI